VVGIFCPCHFFPITGRFLREIPVKYSTQGFLSTARRGIVVRANQLQTFTGLFKILYSDSHWVFQGHVVSPMQQIHGRYTGEQDCLAVLVDHATRNDILRKVDPELQRTNMLQDYLCTEPIVCFQ
jgi:hypothetical protein